MKKRILALSILLALLITCLSPCTVSDAYTPTFDESKIKETITCTYNGVQRSIFILDNEEAFIKVGEEEPLYCTSYVKVAGFDQYGTVWAIDSMHYVLWLNTDLSGLDFIGVDQLIESITVNETYIKYNYVKDAESLVFDDQGYVTGYKSFSGEIRPILSLDEMKDGYSPSNTATPEPAPTSSPKATVTPALSPTPVWNLTPKPSRSPVPVSNPGLSPTSSPTPNRVSDLNKTAEPEIIDEEVLELDSGYTGLYAEGKLYSKYKIKKNVLMYEADKKRTYKKVKAAKYIEKSRNLLFLQKNGNAYVVTRAGKKKLIAKKVKKIICKGDYAVKLKKKNGKTISVVKK